MSVHGTDIVSLGMVVDRNLMNSWIRSSCSKTIHMISALAIPFEEQPVSEASSVRSKTLTRPTCITVYAVKDQATSE